MRPAMRFLLSAGASVLDTQSITGAVTGSLGFRIRGYLISPAQGGITPNTSAVYGGAVIREFYQDEAGGILTLTITGAALANSGWTAINIPGTTTLLRASATYSTSGGNTYWQWTSAANGMGSTSARTVTWT